jgi:hypothetical protein
MLVRAEAMLRTGLDEDGASLADVDLSSLDLENSGPFEDDVELVVLVRLLPVGLGRDENVDADLETGRFVHDLVSACCLAKALLGGAYLECVHVGLSFVATGDPCHRYGARSRCGFAARSLRPAADAASPPRLDPSAMRHRSYAVWWQEHGGPRHAGKLQLGRLHLLLSNASGRTAVPLDQIVSVEYRRGELELELRHGNPLRIGNLDGIGALLELSDALAA